MYLVQKNKKFVGGKLYTYKYLLCSSKRKGLCMEAANIRLDDSEAVFKEILVNVGALGLIQTEAAAITEAMAVVDASLHSEQTTRARHMKKLAEPDAPEFLYELVATADQNIKRLKAERAELERKHTAQTIAQSDKAWLLDNLPMVERDDRQRANALLVRLGVVATIKGGDIPTFNVYQKERLIMKIRVVDGKPETTSYSTDVTMRMLDQGELQEHQLEVNVGFGSKKLPKPGDPVPLAKVREPSSEPVPDWGSYEGDKLPDEAYEMLGITGFGDDPVFHETPLHAPDD
ncbi:MAG TPA: hypothetical protein DDX04_05585 [Massilia sp.]|nr:hypothetical protein [Massilia sp.]